MFELGLTNEFTRAVMHTLGDSFTLGELRSNVETELDQSHQSAAEEEYQSTAEGISMLASSNYEVQFRPGQRLSERIIFPASPSQSNGIEDARFVRFQNDDGPTSITLRSPPSMAS